MMIRLFPCLLLVAIACGNSHLKPENEAAPEVRDVILAGEKWTDFLRQLPVVDSPVLDYRGKPVSYQGKAVGIIPYDVGTADLQQCADALMRLRAEYLFKEEKFDAIGFHFVSGRYYAFKDYCLGLTPVASGNTVKMVMRSPRPRIHQSLRNYLDIVYTYASTISLARELKPASDFAIGTIVIHPGSPGHCFIIIDEKTENNIHYFKLAEGYTPAQSIYVLRNENVEGKDPWHTLAKGKTIETASYIFDNYQLKKFE
jgi:hypothetical protein